MKSFKIFPDKARALGNVMNTNSNVGDMVGVNSNIIPLLNEEHPISLDDGGEYVPPATVDYDNFQFPIFQMEVLGSLYETSLTLNVSTNSPYVGDNITITATLRDNNNELLDGNIAFFCGDDCITYGNNTGENVIYASTTNGVVSFTYSFDSMGEYIIKAVSPPTHMHHCAETTESIIVYKHPISIRIYGDNTQDNGQDNDGDDSINDNGYASINDSDNLGSSNEYIDEIQFKVLLYDSVNEPITGLPYYISLDGESFDAGTSTANGKIYTISNLDSGEHTLGVYCPGNQFYGSNHETVEVSNGIHLFDIYVSYDTTSWNAEQHLAIGDLKVDIYHDTNPVAGLPLTLIIDNDYITFQNQETDSNGAWSYNGIPLGEGTHSILINTSSTNQFAATSTTKTFTVP